MKYYSPMCLYCMGTGYDSTGHPCSICLSSLKSPTYAPKPLPQSRPTIFDPIKEIKELKKRIDKLEKK